MYLGAPWPPEATCRPSACKRTCSVTSGSPDRGEGGSWHTAPWTSAAERNAAQVSGHCPCSGLVVRLFPAPVGGGSGMLWCCSMGVTQRNGVDSSHGDAVCCQFCAGSPHQPARQPDCPIDSLVVHPSGVSSLDVSKQSVASDMPLASRAQSRGHGLCSPATGR